MRWSPIKTRQIEFTHFNHDSKTNQDNPETKVNIDVVPLSKFNMKSPDKIHESEKMDKVVNKHYNEKKSKLKP